MSEVQKLGRDVQLRVSVERYDIVESSASSGSFLKTRMSIVKSGQHVEFTFRVQHEAHQWQIRKRFSEVADLHDILKRRLPSVPKMPEKSTVRQFSVEYLEQRKTALQVYIQELVRRRDAVNCREVQVFFGMPDNVPTFRQPSGCEPVQSAEVQEAVFGITSFVYEPMQGLLLLGASDCSWTSRMDTKITNIKLPWEPAAPNLPTSQMSLWRQSPADLRFDMQFTCRFTHTISCVVLCPNKERGFALCGLSNGTVGYHSIRGEPGVSNLGSTLPLLRHAAAVVALASDDAEGWVISASKDNAVMIYDTRRQMIVSEVQTPAPTSTMFYSKEQKRLFCGLTNGRVIVWNTSTLPIQQLSSIPDASDGMMPSNARISALDYDISSGTLFTGSKEGFRLYQVKNSPQGCWARFVGQIPPAANTPTAVCWASSSREILAGLSTGSVVVFDIDSGEATFAFQAHQEEVSSMLWLDAPRRLLTASKDKTLKIWDFPSLTRVPLEEQSAFISTQPTASSSSTAQPNNNSSVNNFSSGNNSRGSDGRNSILDDGSLLGSRRASDADDPLLALAGAAAGRSGGGLFGSSRETQQRKTFANDGACGSSSFTSTSAGGYSASPSSANPMPSNPLGGDPLAGLGRRQTTPAGSVPSPGGNGSYTSAAASLAYAQQEAQASSLAAGPLSRPTNPLGGGNCHLREPPVTVAAAPLRQPVAGATPGALASNDSDDDLAGWDS